MPTVNDLSKCKFCGELIVWTKAADKFLPKNPDGTDHRESCSAIPSRVRASVRATNHETQVGKFFRSAKKQKAKRTKSSKCTFCASSIEWREKVPFNPDGTRHVAGCSGRLKNLMQQMITEARKAASDSLANGI